MSEFFLFLYLSVWILLVTFGIHRYYLTFLYHTVKRKSPELKKKFVHLPEVTVQLPVYNEMYVVKRLVQAACSIDYPGHLLEIQVLDDSTDETSAIAKEEVEKFKKKRVNIKYVHRNKRTGFKAGALKEGMEKAEGEFFAIFDADFIPHPAIFTKALHHFTDPEVGMVQVRWEHINKNYSVLTRIQSLLLDGHFVIEHTARSRSGRFFNFNGTAGIWRKKCIESAGGWHADTLTEDLDLSYRAQLKGWKFVYLMDEVSSAELPVEMSAFKNQQFRWAKGSIQTAKKILPGLIRSRLPLKLKIEAIAHLTGNTAYLCLFLLSLLIYPLMAVKSNLSWLAMRTIYISLLFIGTGAVSFFYLYAQKEINPSWKSTILYLPVLMSLGIGISVNNTRAVLEGLFGYNSAFKRTPKYHIESKEDTWKGKKYFEVMGFITFFELLLGIYFFFTVLLAFKRGIFISVPFLFIFL
ncbi:MAG: cellulose synthase family protein, partial [Thermodesulfobacteriota bacterium]|nr:cellulose synthase family protein [Thermodesulfobacteriota bacterium]